MVGNWRIGAIFGIPVFIDYSWFVILVLVTVVNAGDLNAQELAGSFPLLTWMTGLVMALLLFISVLLHELGHSLVARSQGIKVNSITLFLFGGIASIDRESSNPQQALQVAIAGPLVSFALFLLFSSLTHLFASNHLFQFVTLDLARINLVLAIFNLIPGLPLDGGQVLKAIVWKITGDRFQGMHWACASGKLIGWLGVSLGLFLILVTGEVGAIWITLIAWFVLRNANSYDQLTSLQEALLKIQVAEAMTREFRVVDANLSIRDFATEYILSNTNNSLPYYAASEGRYRGLILIQDLQNIERSEWEEKKLRDIAHPLTEIPSVSENSCLLEVVKKLETISDRRLTVLSPAGAVAGIIDRGDIIKAIALEQNLLIADSEIKRIKAEATYPPSFPLAAIAKTID